MNLNRNVIVSIVWMYCLDTLVWMSAYIVWTCPSGSRDNEEMVSTEKGYRLYGWTVWMDLCELVARLYGLARWGLARMDKLDVKLYQLYGLVTNWKHAVILYGIVIRKGRMYQERKYRSNGKIGISYRAYISTCQNKQSINLQYITTMTPRVCTYKHTHSSQ